MNLKAQNAALEQKQSKNKEEDDQADDEADEEQLKLQQQQQQLKLKQQQNIYHLVSPALVNAIAANLQNNKAYNAEKAAAAAATAAVAEESAGEQGGAPLPEETVSFDDAKLEETSPGELANESEEVSKANQETLKEITETPDKEEAGAIAKDSEDQAKEVAPATKPEDELNAAAANSGLNIQSILNNMKAKLSAQKVVKQKATAVKEKGKHKKGVFDDAYAQIGSSDPNVKKRKTILGRDKKRRLKKYKANKHKEQ